jgi:SAM-dependent methyltransferase
MARRLVGGRSGRLLDYGCGDGTFLAMIYRDFIELRGIDSDANQTAESARRLAALTNVRFATVGDFTASTDRVKWDVVTCMEVLEHCVEEERRHVLEDLAHFVSPSGIVVISVPIEVGPSLLGKQFFRALAGVRRLGDYEHRERYTVSELLRAAFGRSVDRPSYAGLGASGTYQYHGHKGFDFRTLQREISEHLHIARRLFTPVPWFGPVLNSQVWFVCEPQRS